MKDTTNVFQRGEMKNKPNMLFNQYNLMVPSLCVKIIYILYWNKQLTLFVSVKSLIGRAFKLSN